eukprot:9499494-Pyramimonas_sp.AAC.1
MLVISRTMSPPFPPTPILQGSLASLNVRYLTMDAAREGSRMSDDIMRHCSGQYSGNSATWLRKRDRNSDSSGVAHWEKESEDDSEEEEEEEEEEE